MFQKIFVEPIRADQTQASERPVPFLRWLISWLQKNRQAKPAQGIVEFALAFPVFLVMVLGVIEAGHLLFVYSSISSASREAARYGSAMDNFNDCTGIVAAASRVGFIAGINSGHVSIRYDNPNTSFTHTGCPPPSSIAIGDRIIVTVNYPYKPIVPLVDIPEFPMVSRNAHTIVHNLYLVVTPVASPTPKPGTGSIHISDLDASAALTPNDKWAIDVTITVQDANGDPVDGVIVSGSWGNGLGTGMCMTGGGQCKVRKTEINRNTNPVTFTVSNLSGYQITYASGANSDPDGDSNGTSIVVNKP